MVDQPICQAKLPDLPGMKNHTNRLPGLTPVTMDNWLTQDDAFAAQMAYRDHLIDTRTDDVHACSPAARTSAGELLDTLLVELPATHAGYKSDGTYMHRPDGVAVPIHRDMPLLTVGRLVQEDIAILQKDAEHHLMTAGLICFPAHWRLAEKIGRTLTDLHTPVSQYNPDIAMRIERLFTRLRPNTPLQRANVLIYTDPDLHQPASERTSKPIAKNTPRYIRSERQTLRRLPGSGSIIFAIHTYIVKASSLSPDQYQRLSQIRPALLSE